MFLSLAKHSLQGDDTTQQRWINGLIFNVDFGLRPKMTPQYNETPYSPSGEDNLQSTESSKVALRKRSWAISWLEYPLISEFLEHLNRHEQSSTALTIKEPATLPWSSFPCQIFTYCLHFKVWITGVRIPNLFLAYVTISWELSSATRISSDWNNSTD